MKYKSKNDSDFLPIELLDSENPDFYDTHILNGKKLFNVAPIQPVWCCCPACGVTNRKYFDSCCTLDQNSKVWYETWEDAEKMLPLIKSKHDNPNLSWVHGIVWLPYKKEAETPPWNHLARKDYFLPWAVDDAMDFLQRKYPIDRFNLLWGILLSNEIEGTGTYNLDVTIELYPIIFEHYSKVFGFENDVENFVIDFIVNSSCKKGATLGNVMVKKALTILNNNQKVRRFFRDGL